MRGHVPTFAAVAAVGLLAAAAPAQSNYPPNSAPPPAVTPPAPTYEQLPAPQPAAPPTGYYQPVYRLVDVNHTDHVFTTNREEVDHLTRSNTHRQEGVNFYVMDKEYSGSVPLYRFSTPGGKHFLRGPDTMVERFFEQAYAAQVRMREVDAPERARRCTASASPDKAELRPDHGVAPTHDI